MTPWKWTRAVGGSRRGRAPSPAYLEELELERLRWRRRPGERERRRAGDRRRGERDLRGEEARCQTGNPSL